MLGFYPLGAAPLGGVLSQATIYNLPVDATSFALTGQSVGLDRSYAVAVGNGVFTVSWQDFQISVTARSLTVDPLALVFSGGAVRSVGGVSPELPITGTIRRFTLDDAVTIGGAVRTPELPITGTIMRFNLDDAVTIGGL